MADLIDLQRAVHQNAVDHGFWEASEDIPTKLMLMVSELSEALEDYRDGNMEVRLVADQHPAAVLMVDTDGAALRFYNEAGEEVPGFVQKPEGFPTELADVVIRVMDLCGYLGIDLGAVIELKMAYNATRPHLHGRKI